MTVSFNRLNASGHLFTHCPTSTISSSATPTPPTSWTRKPVAAFLLQSPPRRRLTQAHRPGFARHPHHEDAGTASMVLIDCGSAEGNIGAKARPSPIL
jgi:hypothetical protein